jgi:hypothetical protein
LQFEEFQTSINFLLSLIAESEGLSERWRQAWYEEDDAADNHNDAQQEL